MEKERLESLIIDYIDGTLSQEEKTEVERLLSSSNEASQMYLELKEVMDKMQAADEWKPKAGHERMFENSLRAASVVSQSSQIISFRPIIYKAAAAVALVMLGLAGGFWLNEKNRSANELAVLKREMRETKGMMMALLRNNQSASQRMLGANVALTISEADDEIVSALEETMLTDPNTNVRLAALEALSKFIDEPKVRSALAAALSKQDDPVVQIELIQLLVYMREKGVVNDLEKIIEDETNIQAVKDEAHSGILKLS